MGGSLKTGLVVLLVVALADTSAAQQVIMGEPRVGEGGSLRPGRCDRSGDQRNCPRVKAARERRYPGIRKLFAEHELEYPPGQVLLRAFKREKQLELWARPRGSREFRRIKSYEICYMSGEIGPKRRRGDLQVPEGFYHVNFFKPNSDFLLSMKINYPNGSDRIRKSGRDAGGSIFIHGSCVSIGCLAMTDPVIEELYVIALDTAVKRGTRVPVQIFPARLTDEVMQKLRREYCKKPEVLGLWEELKVGYDGFEQDRVPDRFTIRKDGSYRFPALEKARQKRREINWKELEPGLQLAEIDAPVRSSIGDSRFTLVRVDPKRRKLRLLMASELGGKGRTAEEWAREHKLSVAVNAGMFEPDHLTASHYMKSAAHVNNPKLKADNAFLAFDPVDDQVPPVQIIDRRCQDFEKLGKKYGTVIQGIRMVDCRQRNRWSPQPGKWSMVVAAMDRQDRLLFIFTRSPYRVHDFVNMLLNLPLEIRNMMYLEGGPEASLYLNAGGTVLRRFGGYETGFREHDCNFEYWPLPNVIGVPEQPAGR